MYGPLSKLLPFCMSQFFPPFLCSVCARWQLDVFFCLRFSLVRGAYESSNTENIVRREEGNPWACED